MGVLLGELLKTDSSTESLTKKLEDNEQKARATAEAQRLFETSLYGAADASAKLNEKLKTQNQTQIQLLQSTLALAEARRQRRSRSAMAPTTSL